MIKKTICYRDLGLNIHFAIYKQSTCIQLSEEIINKLLSEKAHSQNHEVVKMKNIAVIIFSITGDNRIPNEIRYWLRNNKTYLNIYTCLLGDFENSKNDFGQEIIQEMTIILNQSGMEINFDCLSVDTPIINFENLIHKLLFNLSNLKPLKLNNLLNDAFLSDSNKYQKFDHPIFENKYWNEICKLLGEKPYVERLNSDKNFDVLIDFSDKKPYPRSIILNCSSEILNQIWICLDRIQYIKVLKLPYAEMQEWPKINLDNLGSRLLKLDIRGNNFKNFSFLKKFQNIEKINIAANNLKELPQEIYDLKKLLVVNVYKNSITAIKRDISKLSQIKKLSLYRNLIESVPDEIAKCSNLEYLNLGANPIKFLPEIMGSMQNLKELSLRNCKLNKIPKFLYNMDWLNINLEKNFLSNL